MDTDRRNYKDYSQAKFLIALFIIFCYLMLKFTGNLDKIFH